ncbi:peptide ABC transporter substrate-binding protein [Brevibacillus parabrevis]|uniref:peptide ABC transporter substrate-binding protein n=1 Tax=Brevibacillus parabrevis TaxID=54914 RepID=UPI001C24A22E|nr:peptide ABC transporter substrate-binding protein [Brevibacillus parabrevis]MBU8712240.1 peptide ABC transporter substrate-binding protein [Brevibacillus parabrevis]
MRVASKRFLCFVTAVLVSGVALAGCNFGSAGKNDASPASEGKEGEASAVKQVLNVSEGAEIATLDVAQISDAVSSTVLNNINEGLFRFDDKHQPILAIAQEHKTSEDALTHTFLLRDAKWANGDPVTAQDFEYGWKRVLREVGPFGVFFEMAGIANADKILQGEKKPDDLGIKAIDAKTLEVKLDRANPLFLPLLPLAPFLPQNEKFVEKAGDKYGLEYDQVLANGPFVLNDWKHEQSWQYKKNESYWDAANVQLDEINVYIVKEPSAAVNLYETGKLDRVTGLTSSLADAYKGKEDYQKVATPTTIFMRLNPDVAAFQNENIRRAIGMAIDKESLTDVVLNDGSIPLYGLVPAAFSLSPDMKDYRVLNGQLNKGTVEEAKTLWQKGLAEIGQSGLATSMIVADQEYMRQTSEYLKAQLETNLPGFKLKLKTVPFQQRIKQEKAFEYEIALSTWGPDYIDPMTYLDMWVTGGPANRMKYSNLQFDQLVAQANKELDPRKRYDILLQLEKIIIEKDAAVVPLYQYGEVILQSQKIKGLIWHPSGPEFTYKWTHME